MADNKNIANLHDAAVRRSKMGKTWAGFLGGTALPTTTALILASIEAVVVAVAEVVDDLANLSSAYLGTQTVSRP